MNTTELNNTRVQLYKATPLKLQLVDELIDLIKNCFKGVETTSIDLTDKPISLFHGLKVKSLEIDPQQIGGVLVHWFPKHDISTKTDPFCSAYILHRTELRKIIYRIKSIKNYYESSLNW